MEIKRSSTAKSAPGKRKAALNKHTTVDDVIFNQTGPRMLSYLVGLYSLFCLVIIYQGVVWIVSPLRDGLAFGVIVITAGLIYGAGIFFWAYKIFQASEERSRPKIRYYSMITLVVSIFTLIYLMFVSGGDDFGIKTVRIILTLLLAFLALWSYATNRSEEDDYWNKRKKRM